VSLATTANEKIERAVRDVLADGVFLCVRLGTGAPLVEACRAAVRGGLSVLEITLTTPGALDAIAQLSRDENMVVGGGTVLTRDDARAVADAGGRFALSPVFDADVVEEAHRLGLLAVPGTSTPTEILAAHKSGARMAAPPNSLLPLPAANKADRPHLGNSSVFNDLAAHHGRGRL